MKYRTFEEMSVWQNAMSLAENIFNITDNLPKKEDYGLTSQIRRSALSVSANIAEGFGRGHLKDKIKFYYNAQCSLCERKNHLIYGIRVRYFKDNKCNEMTELINNIWQELNFFITNLSKNNI